MTTEIFGLFCLEKDFLQSEICARSSFRGMYRVCIQIKESRG